MNLKLLFFCLFLSVLLKPADLRRRKFGIRKHEKKVARFTDIIDDYFFEILDGPPGDDDDEEEQNNSDWLFELQEEGQCNPNPCLNDGVCKEKGLRKFKCDCPKPFRGKRCQKGPKFCKRGICGRGECVLTSDPPFYECKCKAPFQPPDCKTYSLCDPNPCMNGGVCAKDGKDFDCQCPPGYTGRFCHVAPDDCFVDDGEFYRGNVSETEDGDECLQWNSHFILDKGTNPFTDFEDKDGLGPHNFCRNPDGDAMPWCFIRRGRRLFWDYCDVADCPVPTDTAPTGIPAPTAALPEPTEVTEPPVPKPPPTEKPSQAPQPTPDGTPPPEHSFSTCGKPQPKKPITRIFGGLKVAPGAVPWQVSLQVRTKNTTVPFKHICGGVLIDSCWVLTAAHCMIRGQDMQVVMGGLSLDPSDPATQTVNVERVIVHENFRETSTAVHNDIALLRLQGTNGVCAKETQFVKAACLPGAPLPDGTECKISGWGATEQSQYGSNHLMEANVLLINQQKCSEPIIYGSVLDSTMLCAGHLQGGVDSCQGDSGGPLTCKENNDSVVYGLVSWGDQCGKKNKPGVYTRVTQFVDWIKSKTQAASA